MILIMSARAILVVDDSDEFRTLVNNSLGIAFDIVEASSETEFYERYRPYTYDLIMMDMRLKSDREGLRL
ncbi:response regulator, partial [Candidatus Parcubacteria bacterium]